jgi:hypothetical protein
VKVLGKENDSNGANGVGISHDIVPLIPTFSDSHQQQPSGMSRPGTYSVLMGHDYGLAGFVPVANVGVVPVLRYSRQSDVQPPRALQARALQAPLPTRNELNHTLHGWTPNYSQPLAHDPAAVQASGNRAPYPNYQFSGGMQAPGRFENPRISQPSVGRGSQASSSLFYGRAAMTPASLRACVPSPSALPQARITTIATPTTIGTAASTIAPTARSSATSAGGSGRGSVHFDNYPPPSKPLPAGLSREAICRHYPNHLHGETLLRVVHGRGEEKGLWKGRQIWDHCPPDGRNYAPNSRHHNYFEQRIRRAEGEASDQGQELLNPRSTKRGRDGLQSDEVAEQGWKEPLSKRQMPAVESNTSSHYRPWSAMPESVSHSPTTPQGPRNSQSMSNVPLNTEAHRTASQSAEGVADIIHSENAEFRNIRSYQLSQQAYGPPQRVPSPGLMRPGAPMPSSPHINNTTIRDDQQSAVSATLASFKAALRQECDYQHRLILELSPDIRKLAPEEQRAQVRSIWKDQYDNWEQDVKMIYDIQLDSSGEESVDVFALLKEIHKRVIADNPAKSEEEREAWNLRAATETFQGCLEAIKGFRHRYAGNFAIQQHQNGLAPGNTARSPANSGVVIDGNAGNGRSIRPNTPPHGASEQIERDDDLDHISKEDMIDDAGVTSNPVLSEEVFQQTEAADSDFEEDVARFEEEMLALEDDGEEPTLTSSTKFSSKRASLSVESAGVQAAKGSASSAIPETAKLARKTKVERTPRSGKSVAAAPAQSAPSPAKIEAQAARRAEIEEEAFRKAAELGADGGWIATQTVTGTDGQVYPVTSHDVIHWYGEYRGSGQPVTDNDAKAAVAWMKNGRPGVHSRYTENSKERKQRESREKNERQRQLRDERGDN